MNLVLSILEFVFVLLGIATLLRYAVWKLTDDRTDALYFLVPLYEGEAEASLRGIIARNTREMCCRHCLVFAVDMGLSREEAGACELFSLDHPQVIYCKPEDLPVLIQK